MLPYVIRHVGVSPPTCVTSDGKEDGTTLLPVPLKSIGPASTFAPAKCAGVKMLNWRRRAANVLANLTTKKRWMALTFHLFLANGREKSALQ